MAVNKSIQFLSNTTGSGKTEYITDTIAVNSDERYILVVPNRELCSEIEKRLIAKGVTQIKTINQLHTPKPVKALRDIIVNKTCRVVITTQASFKHALVDGLKFKKDWNLILDEDFSPIIEHEIYFTPSTINVLTDCFEFDQSEEYEQYIDVSPNIEYLDEVFIKQTVKDTLMNNKPFRDLVAHTYSKAYNTFIDKPHLQRINNFKEPTNTQKGIKFYAISMLDMDEFFKFKSVTVSSSCYEHSLSYTIFKKHGVKLSQIELPDEVVITDYSNVTIKYFTDKNWSTQLRNTKVDDQYTMESLVYERCIGELQGSEFIFNANTSFRDNIKGGKLVTSIQGVNKYMNYKNMLFMPSLNASGDFVRFFSYMDIGRTEIDFARNVLSAYQFVSRGAVRDKSNTEPITMYVMDRRTARFLEERFPKSTVEYICLVKQKQKVPNKVKSFVCRVNKRIKDKELVRKATLQKYERYMLEYYGKKVKVKSTI